jgi:hypothetical protein
MNEDLKEIRNAAQNIAIGVGEDLIKVARKYTEFLAAVDPKRSHLEAGGTASNLQVVNSPNYTPVPSFFVFSLLSLWLS